MSPFGHRLLGLPVADDGHHLADAHSVTEAHCRKLLTDLVIEDHDRDVASADLRGTRTEHLPTEGIRLRAVRGAEKNLHVFAWNRRAEGTSAGDARRDRAVRVAREG